MMKIFFLRRVHDSTRCLFALFGRAAFLPAFFLMLLGAMPAMAVTITSCPKSSIIPITLNGVLRLDYSSSPQQRCTNELGAVNQYAFNGNAGQRVYFQGIPGAYTKMYVFYLYFPNGDYYSRPAADKESVRIPQTGWLTLPVDGEYWLFTQAFNSYSIVLALDDFRPEAGWWWNPAEPGRGFAIEKQGNNLMIAGFLYDANGAATWYTAAGPMTNSSTFTHTLDTFANGQCMNCAYKAPSQGASVGEIELNFTSTTSGTLKWPGGQIPIQRFIFGQ